MLLSAQRVRSAQGLTVINLYVYRHAAGEWNPSKLEELERTAELVSQSFEVPRGENALASYLDVFAPEGTHSVEIARAAAAIRGCPDPAGFPAVFTEGGAVFRIVLGSGWYKAGDTS